MYNDSFLIYQTTASKTSRMFQEKRKRLSIPRTKTPSPVETSVQVRPEPKLIDRPVVVAKRKVKVPV